MGKVRTHLIDKKERYKIIGDFFEIVSNFRAKKEVIDFFVGLLTPSEALMMARRIQIARMLLEEKNYDAIRRELKVGFSTITKTDQWLNNRGDEYSLWIKKCLRKIENRDIKTKTYSESLLNRYAHHRFLKDLLR